MCVYSRCCVPKIIKISPCLTKLQLAKLAHFLRHSIDVAKSSVTQLMYLTDRQTDRETEGQTASTGNIQSRRQPQAVSPSLARPDPLELAIHRQTHVVHTRKNAKTQHIWHYWGRPGAITPNRAFIRANLSSG